MNVKEDIYKTLKKTCPQNRIALPRNIDFKFEDNTLTMFMKKGAIGVGRKLSNGRLRYINMQEDSAAFEGWAIVIKANWNVNNSYYIKIDISDSEMEDLPNPKDVFIQKNVPGISSGHYGRFLYRAKKFSEEYKWFSLSPKIKKCVDIYDLLLEEYKCSNHLPVDDAGVNTHPEIQAEASFSENPWEIEKLTNNQVKGNVFRQLGTWLESNDGSIQFMTAGRSAIDLWNITNNTLNIFELKAVTKSNSNYKIGIITELFLYMEYCYEMFLINSRFKPRGIGDVFTDGRGYWNLVNAEIENIKGYFLSNRFHPLINSKVIELLNSNQSRMKYIKLPEYDLHHILQIRKNNVN